MKNQPINPALLNQLFALINSGQSRAALPEIHRQLTLSPTEPNLLHLAGIASAATGRNAEALSYFKKSLQSAPNQPAVLNNLANLLKKMGEISNAKIHFQKAVSLSPNFLEAQLGLATLEYDQQSYGEARKIALSTLDAHPKNLPVLNLLGNISKKTDEFEKAITFFEQALSIKPEYVPAIYGLAATYSEIALDEKALPLFEKASRLRPNTAEIEYSLALTQLNLNRFDQAEANLKNLIAIHPLYIDAHKTLNEIYWQQGKKSAFCASYVAARSSNPKSTELTISHVESLLAAGDVAEAEHALESDWADSSNPNIQFLRGKIAEGRSQLREALPLYESSYEQLKTTDIAKQLITAQIQCQQFDKAQELLTQHLRRYPDDQLLWALQGTCWKMTDSEKYAWLIQDNRFIQEFEIPTPDGFASLDDFLDQLKEHLLAIHNLEAQPLNQSVREGIQTPGRLLHKPNPVIQALKASFTEVVSHYIESMPTDTSHPLLRRKSSDFTFSGSWSVLLRGGGHHVSHVHPAGWISSAFYAAVPPNASRDKLAAGDIYFGQSPYQLGERDDIECHLTPTAGKLVLFPSFTWHGTVPLPLEKNAPERITTPFDVTPRSGHLN